MSQPPNSSLRDQLHHLRETMRATVGAAISEVGSPNDRMRAAKIPVDHEGFGPVLFYVGITLGALMGEYRVTPDELVTLAIHLLMDENDEVSQFVVDHYEDRDREAVGAHLTMLSCALDIATGDFDLSTIQAAYVVEVIAQWGASAKMFADAEPPQITAEDLQVTLTPDPLAALYLRPLASRMSHESSLRCESDSATLRVGAVEGAEGRYVLVEWFWDDGSPTAWHFRLTFGHTVGFQRSETRKIAGPDSEDRTLSTVLAEASAAVDEWLAPVLRSV